jgi:hypothetical protein
MRLKIVVLCSHKQRSRYGSAFVGLRLIEFLCDYERKTSHCPLLANPSLLTDKLVGT